MQIMRQYPLLCITASLLIIHNIKAISSPVRPYATYKYSTELQANLADLWWSIDDARKEITFELHMKTTGWIALGISPAGGMKGADVGLGWIDQAGRLYFQDRYASGPAQPLVDNTTADWVGLQGREVNGWTAIQFKRLLDTCDSMDVPIKSGTNILIFAHGLVDPDMTGGKATITYHGDRRDTRMIPLQSYGNPSLESKFAGLDYFDFQLNNYSIPAADTTYHCKVYRAPTNYPERRHAIAHRTLVDQANRDIVHHLLMYECNPTAVFDDNKLPNGPCEENYGNLSACTSNIATGWAVGGDAIVEFPEVAGYPVGGDFEIKYYMVQMHYDNPHRMSNRTDSSGIRFYLGKERRQHDLGYLTLGTFSSVFGIAIPPGADRFIVDSYCPANGTKRIPQTGITIISAFPHTHLQGRSVSTKIIREKKAVKYLFNGDAYDFNYQFENRLPESIKLYPGDELATRCVYSTKDKNVVTLGGESTRNEMCLHMFTYYPRVNNMYSCLTGIPTTGWTGVVNSSVTSWSYETLEKWLVARQWTPELITQWQEFYNNASRVAMFGPAGGFVFESMPRLPQFEDLKAEECKRVNGTTYTPNAATHQYPLLFFTLVLFLLTLLF